MSEWLLCRGVYPKDCAQGRLSRGLCTGAFVQGIVFRDVWLEDCVQGPLS